MLHNGAIVAHGATYAHKHPLSIIGGMITAPAFRGAGYGTQLLADLVQDVRRAGNTPLLYTYKPNLRDWYCKNGGMVVADCGKLEFPKHV